MLDELRRSVAGSIVRRPQAFGVCAGSTFLRLCDSFRIETGSILILFVDSLHGPFVSGFTLPKFYLKQGFPVCRQDQNFRLCPLGSNARRVSAFAVAIQGYVLTEGADVSPIVSPVFRVRSHGTVEAIRYHFHPSPSFLATWPWFIGWPSMSHVPVAQGSKASA